MQAALADAELLSLQEQSANVTDADEATLLNLQINAAAAQVELIGLKQKQADALANQEILYLNYDLAVA